MCAISGNFYICFAGSSWMSHHRHVLLSETRKIEEVRSASRKSVPCHLIRRREGTAFTAKDSRNFASIKDSLSPTHTKNDSADKPRKEKPLSLSPESGAFDPSTKKDFLNEGLRAHTHGSEHHKYRGIVSTDLGRTLSNKRSLECLPEIQHSRNKISRIQKYETCRMVTVNSAHRSINDLTSKSSKNSDKRSGTANNVNATYTSRSSRRNFRKCSDRRSPKSRSSERDSSKCSDRRLRRSRSSSKSSDRRPRRSRSPDMISGKLKSSRISRRSSTNRGSGTSKKEKKSCEFRSIDRTCNCRDTDCYYNTCCENSSKRHIKTKCHLLCNGSSDPYSVKTDENLTMRSMGRYERALTERYLQDRFLTKKYRNERTNEKCRSISYERGHTGKYESRNNTSQTA